MLGERCEKVELDSRGVLGDRLWAVRDGEGKLGSGKMPGLSLGIYAAVIQAGMVQVGDAIEMLSS